MTRNDARATMWSIEDIAMHLSANPDECNFADGMQLAVNCADEVHFTSLADAQQALADSAFTVLAALPMAANEAALASCLSYPSPLDPSVTDPVVSDIPTLIYNGQLDNETPVAWGRDLATGFSNVTTVEWRNQGHVVGAHDLQFCAGDIAGAFLDDPAKAPDTSCSGSDAYRLKWTLP
ncbi:MAG: alpha/beta hydrolase [Chloroflexota bacterium]